MKSFLKATLIWAIVAIIGVVLVVGFGLYNVSARQGHLPGVSWVLHTAYRSAVWLRAPSEEEVPDLTSPALIALGRSHYEDACAFCHAMPEQSRTQTVLSMLPAPPHVTEAVSHWEPRHMFWIVKNGVKMSGMPAWTSAKRDDDVWSVVAFLNAVKLGELHTSTSGPDQVEPGTGYAEDPGTQFAGTYQTGCERCHGETGFARGNVHIPRLDTLSASYIVASLEAYRSGARQSGVMQQAASQLSDEQIVWLADYILSLRQARLKQHATDALDPAMVARGDRLAHGGDEKSNVPACASCHGPSSKRTSERFPPLAGQSELFLREQLSLWKSETRGGTERALMMHDVVPELADQDIRALAQYYASLPPPQQ
jgi:cytochrome c oxidase subunit 1